MPADVTDNKSLPKLGGEGSPLSKKKAIQKNCGGRIKDQAKAQSANKKNAPKRDEGSAKKYPAVMKL